MGALVAFPRWQLPCLLTLFLLCTGSALAVTGDNVALSQDLTTLSLESLANIEVTSVSRRAEKLSGAAAAVYVLTGERQQLGGCGPWIQRRCFGQAGSADGRA
jgi:hypothetical protein